MDVDDFDMEIEAVRAEERERCAKMADDEGQYKGCGCPCCASRAAAFDELAATIRNLKNVGD